ncbi:dispanin subfamily A member 2b-like [Nelusetta ayraudi]|uniref:dispanin subfamily A member 2b-like n=1 Tax=Nelusetta ayraudi TaxID=303726 RepID=UPI003F6E642C
MDVEGGRPAPGVQMQDYQQQPGGVQGYPQQPGGAAAPPLVQYTTVNMVAEPPKDHIIWSLCCFVYSNPCCLGLVALIFSIKARDRKMLGDLQGAQHYGSTARTINIASTGLVCFIVVIVLISTIATVVKAQQAARNYNSYYNGY